MAGRDRVINPITRDYVRDEATGTSKTTRNASTSIYHQAATRLGQWWGDPKAGSLLYQLERAKSLLRTPVIIRDIFSQFLQPLIDKGAITPPSFESLRRVDRIDTEATVLDLQSGEELKLSDLLPYVP